MKDTICRYVEKYGNDGLLSMSFLEMISDLHCSDDELFNALDKLKEENWIKFYLIENHSLYGKSITILMNYKD